MCSSALPDYELRFAPAALRDLRRLRRADRRLSNRILDKLSALRTNPRPPDSTRLTGSAFWRVRVGAYRAIYLIEDGEVVVLIVRVRHRSEVYDQLESL